MLASVINRDLTRATGLYAKAGVADALKTIAGARPALDVARRQRELIGTSHPLAGVWFTPPMSTGALISPMLEELNGSKRISESIAPLIDQKQVAGLVPQIAELTEAKLPPPGLAAGVSGLTRIQRRPLGVTPQIAGLNKLKLAPLGYDTAQMRGVMASLPGHPVLADVGAQLQESLAGRFAGIAVPKLPGLTADFVERSRRWLRLSERMDVAREALAQGEPLAARLAFVLEHVGFGRALNMMEMLVAEGPNPLIDALEAVLVSEKSLTMFNAAVAEGRIGESAQIDLKHGLEHVAEGDYDRAFPPLIHGLEGALRAALRERGDRRKRANARAVADAMKLERDHRLMIHTVYNEANDGRHGNAIDRRAACVLALVGLLVWVDAAYETPALEWLGHQLDRYLVELHDGELAA